MVLYGRHKGVKYIPMDDYGSLWNFALCLSRSASSYVQHDDDGDGDDDDDDDVDDDDDDELAILLNDISLTVRVILLLLLELQYDACLRATLSVPFQRRKRREEEQVMSWKLEIGRAIIFLPFWRVSSRTFPPPQITKSMY